MEWNFLFRVDHLNEKGEERNLKGLIITKENQTPTPEQIQQFLLKSGFNVQIHDPEKLVFLVSNQHDPVKITIVSIDNDKQEKVESDRVIKLLSQQFRKNYNL